MKRFLSIFMLALLVLPLGVSAIPEAPSKLPETFATTDDLFNYIRIALNWIFYALLVLALFYILLIAINYVTQGGSGGADSVKDNGKKLSYILLGIALALIAKGLVYVVCYLVSGAGYCKY
ncbi:MAG: hypothetical protein WC483_02485 [Candidatus Paceibacterota bacterium]|nr:hypothetical protein [Candidatus Paceibacterota bacterium]